jgi:hypothetical protein
MISGKVIIEPLYRYIEATAELGDCQTGSLRCYMKLKNAGAKRVRGYRKCDLEGEPAHHFWVENKGLVFEETCGLQYIYHKDEWYEENEITGVEYAEGLLFREEIDPIEYPLLGWLNDEELNRLVVKMEEIMDLPEVFLIKQFHFNPEKRKDLDEVKKIAIDIVRKIAVRKMEKA